ncbi:tetratricopeptide repeat protein [Kitasatospora sp. NPDC059827]|uniref:tetratricopeptide repeat protein n=1 Tax=Kitasatospora sp. NPDC059827 TaxID=3346964 RepID=UPI0036560641
MDAAELDYRARTRSGYLPPELVSRLIERGHAEVVEAWAGRGEWFCAREWARLLGERGQRPEALDVLAPYLATGWWTAVEATAELLEDWGRAEEAIELTRARMLLGHPHALASYTRLLARHGRAGEAFDLLLPHVDDDSLARVLVDVAAVAGRDDEAAALLEARIPAGHHRCDSPWCCRGLDTYTTIGLLARVRERQGRVDEAIALLSALESNSIDARDQLAGLLARHGRIEELRAYAAAEDHGRAARRLAVLLEERGDVEGAVAVYRQAAMATVARGHVAVHLAQLLARHGRSGDAIGVMRALADAPGGAEDWIVDTLCTLYADQGRPQDALAYLDDLKARRGTEEWELFWIRLPLMAACDRVDEAIEQAQSHPEGGTPYAAAHVARTLAGAGRTEEAVTVLEQHAPTHHDDLAGYLIDLGRPNEAVAVLQQHGLQPLGHQSSPCWYDQPPF